MRTTEIWTVVAERSGDTAFRARRRFLKPPDMRGPNDTGRHSSAALAIPHLSGLTGSHNRAKPVSVKRHKANFPVTPPISNRREIFPSN